MKKLLNNLYLLIFIFGALATAFSFFAEYSQGFEPCPLCIAQRVVIMGLTAFAFIFMLHNPHNILNKIYNIIIILISGFGLKLAFHHKWLMDLPADQQPLSCGMPLSVLYERVPLNHFLQVVLQGDAECGKVTWIILGMTPPVALMVFYFIVIAIAILNFIKK